MISAIGLVVLFVCVFGGYIMAGGSMAPIMKAAPIETFIIAGAAIAAMLIGNSMDIVKGAAGGLGRALIESLEPGISALPVVLPGAARDRALVYTGYTARRRQPC